MKGVDSLSAGHACVPPSRAAVPPSCASSTHGTSEEMGGSGGSACPTGDPSPLIRKIGEAGGVGAWEHAGGVRGEAGRHGETSSARWGFITVTSILAFSAAWSESVFESIWISKQLSKAVGHGVGQSLAGKEKSKGGCTEVVLCRARVKGEEKRWRARPAQKATKLKHSCIFLLHFLK